MLGKEGYNLRWFNEITYYGEYLEDGLTAKGNLLFQKNPKGFLYVTKLELSCYPNDKIKWYLLIHITFVLSAFAMGYLDKITRK